MTESQTGRGALVGGGFVGQDCGDRSIDLLVRGRLPERVSTVPARDFPSVAHMRCRDRTPVVSQ